MTLPSTTNSRSSREMLRKCVESHVGAGRFGPGMLPRKA